MKRIIVTLAVILAAVVSASAQVVTSVESGDKTGIVTSVEAGDQTGIVKTLQGPEPDFIPVLGVSNEGFVLVNLVEVRRLAEETARRKAALDSTATVNPAKTAVKSKGNGTDITITERTGTAL